MTTRPIVAVVPFGARAEVPEAGAWARQIARRVVERLRGERAIELREVFLVTLPEPGGGPGYLVVGSTPDLALAAGYGASLGCTHSLVGSFVEGAPGRALELVLVDVETKTERASAALPIAPEELQGAEAALVDWLARTLGVDVVAPPAPAASETAYRALLEALDEEQTARLLARGDRAASRAAAERSRALFLDALRADPGCAAAEERLLVGAAESRERGDEREHVGALEQLSSLAPRSWRAHYLLGELRRVIGETPGAIVAFEHAHALRPLRDADLVRLAELYGSTGTPGPGLAHLRRIAPESPSYAEARRLAGALLVQRGDLAAAAEALREALARGAPEAARLELARVLVAAGDGASARSELDSLITPSTASDVAAQARRLRFGLVHPELERRLERAGAMAVSGEAGSLDAAEADLARVLAAEPELWEAHFGLGLVAMRREDSAAAAAAFKRVLEIWPEQPDAAALLEAG